MPSLLKDASLYKYHSPAVNLVLFFHFKPMIQYRYFYGLVSKRTKYIKEGGTDELKLCIKTSFSSFNMTTIDTHSTQYGI